MTTASSIGTHEGLKERVEQFVDNHPAIQTALAVNKRFSEVRGGQLAASITLSAFLSLFPLLLVGIAVIGFLSAGSNHFAADVIRHLGLSGETADTMVKAIATAETSRRTASIIGFLGLLWSGLGLVGALQDAYDVVDGVRGRGWRDKLVGLGWLAGAFVLLGAAIGLNALPVVGGLAFLALPFALLLNGALFLWTAKVLPNRNVPWRDLLGGAVLGAIGLQVLTFAGAYLVPRMAASASALYGSLGLVFALLGWFALLARLIVYTAVYDAVRWERRPL